MPYNLLENNSKIDSGYLLSTRDLCGLDYIPKLIKAGVNCLKIEGRMKNPEYVATVTRIYRKYIDLALSEKPYEILEQDEKDLAQVFNRGMFSSGHLDNNPNENLIYKEKPGNQGLFLGKVQKTNINKGYITLKLKEPIEIGDTVSFENEDSIYTISELMENSKNITETKRGQIVTIGRMKGNIKLGDLVYKMSSKALNITAKESYKTENRKIKLNCKVSIKKDKPLSISITSANNIDCYKDMKLNVILDIKPEEAKNKPLTKDAVVSQISKTSSTPYSFEKIQIDLDENLFLPKISSLNELRRQGLEKVTDYALDKIHRKYKNSKNFDETLNLLPNSLKSNISTDVPHICVLFNELNKDYDYSKLEDVDLIYIPLKYFSDSKYKYVLKLLNSKYKTYIYMPSIIKPNYRNLFSSYILKAVKNYNISGFVISNISHFLILDEVLENNISSFDIVANYTLNVFNTLTIDSLKRLGANSYTISPELNDNDINYLCNNSSIPSNLIVYGKIPLMHTNYCLLGKTNKSHPNCIGNCKSENKYYLQDRFKNKFRVIPDNVQTVSTIYHYKNIEKNPKDFKIKFARIDIFDETIEEINIVIKKLFLN